MRNTFRFYVYQSIYTGWWFPSRWKILKSMGRIIQCMKWKIKHVPNHQPVYTCSPQYVNAAPRTARLLVELVEDFLLCGWAVTSTQKHGILVIIPICSMYGIFTYIWVIFGAKWSIWDKIPGSSNFPKGKMGILAKHLPVWWKKTLQSNVGNMN